MWRNSTWRNKHARNTQNIIFICRNPHSTLVAVNTSDIFSIVIKSSYVYIFDLIFIWTSSGTRNLQITKEKTSGCLLLNLFICMWNCCLTTKITITLYMYYICWVFNMIGCLWMSWVCYTCRESPRLLLCHLPLITILDPDQNTKQVLLYLMNNIVMFWKCMRNEYLQGLHNYMTTNIYNLYMLHSHKFEAFWI